MKKRLCMLLVMSLPLGAVDMMVVQGAVAGRLNNEVNEIAFQGGKQVGDRAADIVGNWGDDFCKYAFGVDGETVADRVLKAVIISIAMFGVYKVGQYFVNREPNNAKVHRALQLWSYMDGDLNSVKNLQDVQNFLTKYDSLKEPILKSYNELHARYDSWVKPWNWTVEMKTAFEKMRLVGIVYEYQEPFMLNELELSELLKIAIASFSTQTAYPICAYVEKLQSDIAIMQSAAATPVYKTASIIHRQLCKVLHIIIGSKEYVEERRLLQMAVAIERLNNAVDRRF